MRDASDLAGILEQAARVVKGVEIECPLYDETVDRVCVKDGFHLTMDGRDYIVEVRETSSSQERRDEEPEEGTEVYLEVDDQDRHPEGCKCGACNSNGKSYGCAIFRTRITWEGDGIDPVDRVYGPSEEAAKLRAFDVARSLGLVVVDKPED